jgi:hypothetical protein
MPMGKKIALAPPKVAPEITVCSKFCLGRPRNVLNTVKGILEIAIAIMAPIIDVFAVMPTRVNSSKPMIMPNIPNKHPSINVRGSNKEGCFTGISEGSYFSTLLIGKPILPILVFYWKYERMSIFFSNSHFGFKRKKF